MIESDINPTAFMDNVTTNDNDNKQHNNTKNDVPNAGERKTWLKTKTQNTAYTYFQLREFVGKDSFHLSYKQFTTFTQQEKGVLKMTRNILTKHTIAKIEKWKYRDETDDELLVHNFLDKSEYMLISIQCKDYFHMYKSKEKYSIPYFSNKFVVPMFILSEYPTTYLSCSYIIVFK